MASQRQLRVGEAIKQALASIFIEERFEGTPISGTSVTVSEVRMTPDLKKAIIYVYPLAGNVPQYFLEVLTEYSHFHKQQLAKMLKLRFLPKLEFKLDNSIDYADKVNQIFTKI